MKTTIPDLLCSIGIRVYWFGLGMLVSVGASWFFADIIPESADLRVSVSSDGMVILEDLTSDYQYAMTPNLADAIGQDLQTEARLLRGNQ